MKMTRALVAICVVATLSIFAAAPEELLKPALDAITPDGLLAHIKILASDEFEGRAPGSKGEELSSLYVSSPHCRSSPLRRRSCSNRRSMRSRLMGCLPTLRFSLRTNSRGEHREAKAKSCRSNIFPISSSKLV